jgi:hypothetical protein
MQWISIAVTFLAATIFGILAHRSPKEDWEFIKNWPAIVLLLISAAIANVEYAQKSAEQALADFEINCNWKAVTEALPIPIRECKFMLEQGRYAQVPPPNPLVEQFLAIFVSMLQDAPLELIGMKLGMSVSKLTDRDLKPA